MTAIDGVVVGGSAGALEALGGLLRALPQGFALPVAVVVHLPRHRGSALAEALAPCARVPVREALDKEPFVGGMVLVAPPDYHLLVDDGPRLALSTEPPVNHSLPSIDVLFESAAATLGPRVAGVVLSGANEDGARGLAAVVRAGGAGFVQAPAEAAMRAMPDAALAACPAARALGVAGLASALGALAAGGVASAGHAP